MLGVSRVPGLLRNDRPALLDRSDCLIRGTDLQFVVRLCSRAAVCWVLEDCRVYLVLTVASF